MDGRTRQNPAYRLAKGRAPTRGLFLFLIALACALAAPPGIELGAPAAPARAAAAEPKGWRPDVKRARQYAKHRTGDVLFAIVDPERRRDDFHGGRTAPMASTVKVMLLAAYLRERSVRDRGLNESDRDLLGPMIRRSDNAAATRVRNIVGEGAIRRVARDAHMRHFSYNSAWGLCRTSAGDQASFMYRFEDTIPDRHEGYARNLLAAIVPSQRWGVARARPKGWKLYFKGGWGIGDNVNHQIAFLDRGDERIALAILTEASPGHQYGKKTLEGVASRLLRGLRR
jgi:Beta-lactamase enzyme family